MVGPGDINIAAQLQQSMRWDITSLVQSVNLTCAKKVYCSNRPKYFFFSSRAESRATFLKLVFDRVSKFGWMKNQLQFCVLKFKVVLSFFQISKFIASSIRSQTELMKHKQSIIKGQGSPPQSTCKMPPTKMLTAPNERIIKPLIL